MSALVPLPVVVPLVAAAVLAASSSLWSRRAADLVALAATAASVTFATILLVRAAGGVTVYWFAAWKPRAGGIALGIDFAFGTLSAGLAVFVGVLMLAALVFSWRHIDETTPAFQILLLVFLAAMVGFSLSGDLFNLFVFFELMSVAAFALSGYKVYERAPLQGALNFAITNTVGSFLLVSGIALVYARTGALNLAQIGQALAHGSGGHSAVVVAFALIVAGFFAKAAVVPFHFWLADAYATAPTPVCLLFAGVMSELGLYGVARVYFSAFSAALGPHEAELRAILVALGVLTALVGAAMAFGERHLKRMLAFATVSYVGLFLVGIGFLNTDGLAGTGIYVVGDGLAKAALFVCVGIVQSRRAQLDERRLRGQGRAMPYTGLAFALAGLVIAGLPPFGAFLGKAMVEDAALKLPGYGWVPALFSIVSLVTGAAVLRATGRVFAGLGAPEDPDAESQRDSDSETDSEADEQAMRHTPAVMFLPALALLGAALAVGIFPGLADAAREGAARVVSRPAYAAAVLHGHPEPHIALAPSQTPTAADYWYATASTLGALALAMVALLAHRLPAGVQRRAAHAIGPPLGRLRGLHSGHPGDYVAWATTGAALVGAAFVLALR